MWCCEAGQRGSGDSGAVRTCSALACSLLTGSVASAQRAAPAAPPPRCPAGAPSSPFTS